MIDKSVKILLWDIETLPHVGLHWGMWKQNIQPGAIVQQSEMLCLSYKWLGSRRVFNISPINQPGFKDNPYAFSDYICKEFIPVLETCDFAVAHNGDNFDYRKLKAYTVINNLQPFRARKVDTLRMAKSIGMFPKGNRLDSLAEVLGVEQKNKTDFGMWKDIALCKKNMMEQMQKMNDYCNQDVEVLEQVFLKLWPHCEMGLPNVNTLMRNDRTIVGCDKCGSLDNVKNGRYIKNVLIYQRYMCKDCGAQFLSRSAIKQGE